MILLLIILFLTVLEAAHEGLALRRRSFYDIPSWIPGVVEFVKLFGIAVAVLFLMWYQGYDDYFKPYELWKFWRIFVPQYILGWLFIRYALFDPLHNIFASLPWYFIGETKLFDRLMQLITRRQEPKWFSFWSRLVLGLAGISLILTI